MRLKLGGLPYRTVAGSRLPLGFAGSALLALAGFADCATGYLLESGCYQRCGAD